MKTIEKVKPLSLVILLYMVFLVSMMLALTLSSCQNVSIIEADTYIRTIDGHAFIICENPAKGGLAIIHSPSCPAPDSTHVQRVRIVPR